MAGRSSELRLHMMAPHAAWEFLWLLRRAAFATWRDGCLGIAKAAAYSALLSFFPVLTSVTTILVQAKAESVSRVLAQFLLGVVPPGTQELVQYSVTVRGARPGLLLVVAIIVSIWAASGLMASLIEGFHRAYRMRSNRGIVRERLVAILLVFFAALPAIGASALILFGTRTEHWLLAWLGVLWPGERLSGWVAWFGMLIRVGVAVGTIVLVTALLYHFGPARPRVWRRVWPGALVATILWLLATMAFAWYVRNIANYNVLYGSIGAVIALLVWMYLLAVIALLGCEFNAERDRVAAPAPAAEHEPA